MLDLPELFAPARIVRGAMSMDCSRAMDLKPATVIREIEGGGSGVVGFGGLFDRLDMSAMCPGKKRTRSVQDGIPRRSVGTRVERLRERQYAQLEF